MEVFNLLAAMTIYSEKGKETALKVLECAKVRLSSSFKRKQS